MTAPAFTVVVPAFNAGAGVRTTLDAVLAQELTDFDVIVVDDGSIDDTTATAAATGDPRVRVLSQPNRGVSAARNAGLAVAEGRYVVFVDCDDVPDPRWLSTFAELLAPPDVVAAFVGATYRSARGEFLEEVVPRPQGPVFGDLTAVFLSGTMAIETTLVQRIGGFTSGLGYSENTELGIRISEELERHGGSTAHCRSSLVTLYDPGVTPGRAQSRALRDDVRFESARYLVERHHARLHRDPASLSTYYSILGVTAVRLGRRDSTRWFGRALLADPLRPRNAARFLASLFPGLSRRLWPQT